jgi:hypothetical protein
MIELVIASYQECVDWRHSLDVPSVVYHKGPHGDLPNVGFEAQTFCHHFASRYDSLSPITICLQGDPFPHLPQSLASILPHLDSVHFSFLPLSRHSSLQTPDGGPHHPGLGPANEAMWQALTGHCPPDLWYAWYGGQFAVHRDRVRARPRAFWEMAAAAVLTKEDACAVERLWPYLFS